MDTNPETTPPEITIQIRDLSARIDPTQSPEYVEVRPTRSALPRECFFNAMEQAEAEGGDVQYGWLIWEWPRVLLTAEFHAVWRTPAGDLVDVTPQLDGEKKVLFLPDSTREYEFRPVHNMRMPLNKDPKVRRFIRLYRRIEELRLTTFRPPAVKGKPPFNEDLLIGEVREEFFRCCEELSRLMRKLMRLGQRAR